MKKIAVIIGALMFYSLGMPILGEPDRLSEQLKSGHFFNEEPTDGEIHNSDFFYQSGEALLKGCQYKAAEAAFKRALQTGFEEPWKCYVRLAYMASLRGDDAQALDDLRKAVDLSK
jgi:Flp pilus assembly protein TadD